MLSAAAEHVRRRRSVVLTRLPLDALACVAAMIDALFQAGAFQRSVRVLSPLLSRTLYPLATVERSALRRTATFRVFTVGAPEPLILRSLYVVVLPLGEHHVHMRVVFLTVGIAAAVNRERIRLFLL
jgi:hypothetical protein